MKNNYYQKHKERLKKKTRVKYIKISLKKKKTKGTKRPKKYIKILLKKKKEKGVIRIFLRKKSRS